MSSCGKSSAYHVAWTATFALCVAVSSASTVHAEVICNRFSMFTNLRDAPTSKGSKIFLELENGEEVHVNQLVENSEGKKWLEVIAAGNEGDVLGFVTSSAVADSCDLQDINRFKVFSPSDGFANLRTGPSESADVITELRNGAEFTRKAQKGPWALVVTDDGKEGWIAIRLGVALGATRLPSDSCYFVYASRKTLDEARAFIQQYNSVMNPNLHPDWKIAESTNGWYAVIAGTVSRANFDDIKADKVRQSLAPDDALCSAGDKYVKWFNPQTNFDESPKSMAGDGPLQKVSPGKLSAGSGADNGTGAVSYSAADIIEMIEALDSHQTWRGLDRDRMRLAIQSSANSGLSEAKFFVQIDEIDFSVPMRPKSLLDFDPEKIKAGMGKLQALAQAGSLMAAQKLTRFKTNEEAALKSLEETKSPFERYTRTFELLVANKSILHDRARRLIDSFELARKDGSVSAAMRLMEIYSGRPAYALEWRRALESAASFGAGEAVLELSKVLILEGDKPRAIAMLLDARSRSLPAATDVLVREYTSDLPDFDSDLQRDLTREWHASTALDSSAMYLYLDDSGFSEALHHVKKEFSPANTVDLLFRSAEKMWQSADQSDAANVTDVLEALKVAIAASKLGSSDATQLAIDILMNAPEGVRDYNAAAKLLPVLTAQAPIEAEKVSSRLEARQQDQKKKEQNALRNELVAIDSMLSSGIGSDWSRIDNILSRKDQITDDLEQEFSELMLLLTSMQAHRGFFEANPEAKVHGGSPDGRVIVEHPSDQFHVLSSSGDAQIQICAPGRTGLYFVKNSEFLKVGDMYQGHTLIDISGNVLIPNAWFRGGPNGTIEVAGVKFATEGGVPSAEELIALDSSFVPVSTPKTAVQMKIAARVKEWVETMGLREAEAARILAGRTGHDAIKELSKAIREEPTAELIYDVFALLTLRPYDCELWNALRAEKTIENLSENAEGRKVGQEAERLLKERLSSMGF